MVGRRTRRVRPEPSAPDSEGTRLSEKGGDVMSAVSLGDTFFKTKKATEEHYRRLLWGGQIGARIPAPASAGLFHLLQRHPEFEAKRGAGIGIRETLHGARAFEVVRHDGSRSEFSF